jgi:hypothetical protein
METRTEWYVRIKNRETKRWRLWDTPYSSEKHALVFCSTVLGEYGEASEVEVLKVTTTTERVHELRSLFGRDDIIPGRM